MPKLVDIIDEMALALAAQDEVDGDEDALARIAEYVGELTAQQEDKVDAIAQVKRRLDSEEEYCKSEAKRWLDRAKSITNNRERLKAYLAEAMQSRGLKKLKGHGSTLSLVANQPSVFIENEAAIPAQFIQRIVEERPIKSDIKAALLAGEQVPGARLHHSESVRIR